jgi:CBS domain-containing protein
MKRSLPVRGCQVWTDGETVETHHTVQCPRRHQSTAFERCCGCSHMSSIEVDPDGKHGTVECLVGEELAPRGRVDVAEAAVRVRLGDVIGIDTTCVRGDVKIGVLREALMGTALRAVPVVDDRRHLLGIVSTTDLLRERGKGKTRPKTVAEVMTPVVHGLPEDAPVAYAISLMGLEGLHQVPIVDSHDQVIGMITATDALRWVAQALGYVVPVANEPR